MTPNIFLSLLFAYNELEFLAYFNSESLIYLGNKVYVSVKVSEGRTEAEHKDRE
jgi:hypothetical protein